jgi:hypothetical protein
MYITVSGKRPDNAHNHRAYKKARRIQTQSITEFHATVVSGWQKCMRFIDVYRVGLASLLFKRTVVAGITVETDCFELE